MIRAEWASLGETHMAQVDIAALEAALGAFVQAVAAANGAESVTDAARAKLEQAEAALTEAAQAEAAADAELTGARTAVTTAIDDAVEALTGPAAG